ENEARAVAGNLGSIRPNVSPSRPARSAPSSSSSFCSARSACVARQMSRIIPDIPDRSEVAPDAVTSDRVVAFRERADDCRLVGKVLIERTERHTAAFDDIANSEGFAALFRHQLRRAYQDFFEPLPAALLGSSSAGCTRH